MENSNWNYRKHSSSRNTPDRFNRNEKTDNTNPNQPYSDTSDPPSETPPRRFPAENKNIFSPNENFLYDKSGRNQHFNSIASFSSFLLDEQNFLNTTTLANPSNSQRLYASRPVQPCYRDSTFADRHQPPVSDSPNADSPSNILAPNDNVQSEQQIMEPHSSPSNEESSPVQVDDHNSELNPVVDIRLAELVKEFFPADILRFDPTQQQQQQQQQPTLDTFHQNESQNQQMQHHCQQPYESIANYNNPVNARQISTPTYSQVTKRPHDSLDYHHYNNEAVSPTQTYQLVGVNVGKNCKYNYNQLMQLIQHHQPPQYLQMQPYPTALRVPSNMDVRNRLAQEAAWAQYRADHQLLRQGSPTPINPHYSTVVNPHYMQQPPQMIQLLSTMPPQFVPPPRSTPTFIPGINPNHMHLLQQNNYQSPHLLQTLNGRQYIMRDPKYPQFFSLAAPAPLPRQHIPLDRVIRPSSVLNPYTDLKHPKPVFSYSCLIAMALKNSDTGSLPVNEIYKYMQEKFPYFKTAPEGWKNSVRHNLSLNKAFYKIIKQDDPEIKSQRKGCLWALKDEKKITIEKEINKWLRKHPEAIRKSLSDENDFDSLYQNVDDSSDSNEEITVTLDMNSIENYIIEQEQEKIRKQNEQLMKSEFIENNPFTATSHDVVQGALNFDHLAPPTHLVNGTDPMQHIQPLQNQATINNNNININNNNIIDLNQQMERCYVIRGDQQSHPPVDLDYRINVNEANPNLHAQLENASNNPTQRQIQSNADFVDDFLYRHQIAARFPSVFLPSPPRGNTPSGQNALNSTAQTVITPPNNIHMNVGNPNRELNSPTQTTGCSLTHEQYTQLVQLANHIRNMVQTTDLNGVNNESENQYNNISFNGFVNENPQQSTSQGSDVKDDSDRINLNDIFKSVSKQNHHNSNPF